jgi:hypothetical protein
MVSQLMDEIRAAVIDCRVSTGARVVSAIRISDEYSLLYFHPAHLANHPPGHR